MYNHYVIFFSFLFQIMNLVRKISTSMYLFHHYLFELNRYIFTNFFYFYFKSSFFLSGNKTELVYWKVFIPTFRTWPCFLQPTFHLNLGFPLRHQYRLVSSTSHLAWLGPIRS